MLTPVYRRRIALLFAFVPLGIAVISLVQNPPTTWSPTVILAGLLCLAVFVTADLLADCIESGLWAGYLSLAVNTTWLIMGLTAALWVAIIGGILANFIRLHLGKRLNLWCSGTQQTFIWQILGRMLITGSALLVGAFTFQLLQGQVPLIRLQDNILALGVALLMGLLTTEGVGLLLVGDRTQIGLLWSTDQHSRLFAELLLLAVAPILALMFHYYGVVLFGAVLVLSVFLAFRYREMIQTQQSLNRRIRELSTLKSVEQDTTAQLQFDDMLTSIYQEVHRLISAPLFFIALYNNKQHHLDFPLVIKDEESVYWPPRRLNEDIGLLKYVIENKKRLHISASEIRRLKATGVDIDRVDYATYLYIPLLVGEKCFGVMAVVDDVHEDAFTISDANILQSIADQTALAIRNVMLYDRAVRMAQNLSLINQSVQNVMFNLDSEDAMRAACLTAVEITGTHKAAIYLLEIDQRSFLRLAQSVGLSDAYREFARTLPYDAPTLEQKPYIIESVADTPELSELADVGEFYTRAQIPLRSGNTFVGYLVVYHDQPYFYQQAELELLETLAYQITAALDNAELLKALELYASEQSQLVHLSRISTSSLQLEPVITGVSEIIRQMMGIGRATIGLLMKGNRLLIFQDEPRELAAGPEAVPLSSLPEIEAVTQSALSGLHILHRGDEDLSPGLVEIMARHGDEILIVMPLVANNEVLGVILLGNPEERVFSDGESRLIEMATNQVATQIHNAQLFTRTQRDLNQRLEQLVLIEQLAQQISRTLDHDELIQNVIETARRATQTDLAALAMLTEDDKFRVIGQERVDGQWYQYETMQAKEEGITGYVFRTGKPLRVTNHQALDEYQITTTQAAYPSTLAVPLIKEDRVIGVLNVKSAKETIFTDEQASFLNSLAGHAVISIENARLLEEREYQIQTQSSLRKLSIELSSTTDKSALISTILQAAIQLLQARDASFLSYDAAGQQFDVLNSFTVVEGEYVNHQLAVPVQIIDCAARTGALQIVEDIQTHDDYQAYAALDDVDYGSLLAVPIQHGSADAYPDVLCVAFVNARHFHERDLNTVELLTIQVAGHLENVSLLERIRDGSDRMRAILDATRDGVIMLNRDANLRDANLSAERMLGIHLSDHIGEHFPTLLMEHTNSETGNALTDMARILRLEPERITRREIALQIREQQTYLEEISSPVRDPRGAIIGRLLVFRDITEEKELEAYREEITHMVVHDLRGPLGSIISSLTLAVELVREPASPDNTAILDQMMDISLESGNRLMGLVDTMLDIAKLERREMLLNRSLVTIRELVMVTVKSLVNSIQEARIETDVIIPDDLPALDVDTELIKRVLINLLDNAIRYTPHGGEIRLEVSREEEDFLTVRVADSGRGIPPEEHERIFEKYRMVKNNPPESGRRRKGTGLGLAFCKLVIEAHGGRIWIAEESPLSGACFGLTLPIAAADSIKSDISTTGLSKL